MVKLQPRITYRFRGFDYAKNPKNNDNEHFVVINPSTHIVQAVYDKQGKRVRVCAEEFNQKRIVKQLPDNMMEFLR